MCAYHFFPLDLDVLFVFGGTATVLAFVCVAFLLVLALAGVVVVLLLARPVLAIIGMASVRGGTLLRLEEGVLDRRGDRGASWRGCPCSGWP